MSASLGVCSGGGLLIPLDPGRRKSMSHIPLLCSPVLGRAWKSLVLLWKIIGVSGVGHPQNKDHDDSVLAVCCLRGD